MKFGASIGFQLIDIFNIIEDESLSIDEKKQKIKEYQRSLQTPEKGMWLGSGKGQNNKNGYYVFGDVDEMDYDSLVRTKEYVDKVLTSFTCEGEMKMSSTIAGYDKESHSIKYNFDYGDKVYQYAMKHGKSVRGHTLVWHKHEPKALDMFIEDRLGCTMQEYEEQHPEDFFEKRKQFTKEFLADYMKTMGEQYPECYCWDVLNEVVPQLEIHDPENKDCPTDEERKDGLRHSKWFEYLGKDFYIDVLEIARDNLPAGTKLFYNEFGEHHPEKRKAILQVIERIKQYEEKTGRTILDGIGLQSHYDLETDPEQIEEAHSDFAKTGKEVQITEADIAPGKEVKTGKKAYDPNDPRYEVIWKKIYECAEKFGIKVLTSWGVNDALSWFRNISCTMIRADGSPKKYAQEFIERIQNKKKNGLEDCLDDDKTRISEVKQATYATKEIAMGKTEKEQENDDISVEEQE